MTGPRSWHLAALIAALMLLAASPAAAEEGTPLRTKPLVLNPSSGEKVPARPLSIRVRAGNAAKLTATLNGHPIGRHFPRQSSRGVREVRVTPSHGLRHRRNVLRVKVRPRDSSRATVRTVRFRVATNRPLAAAGLKRRVALHSSVRYNGKRSQLHRSARAGTDRLRYRWRLLSAPRGSRLDPTGREQRAAAESVVSNLGPQPKFTAKGSPTPLLRPDHPGLYRLELTVTGPDGAIGKDQVPLRVDPDPLVTVDTMAKPAGQNQWGVKVGSQFYPDPGNSHRWLQLVVLKPGNLELVSNQAYDCPEANQYSYVNQTAGVQRCVTQLTADLAALSKRNPHERLIAIAVSQRADGPIQHTVDWSIQPPVGAREALHVIGAPPTVAWKGDPTIPLLRGRMSVVGRIGGGGATMHENLDLADLRETGQVKGFLLRDNLGEYSTYASAEHPEFDMQAAGSDAFNSVMRVGEETFTEHFAPQVAGSNTEGGFHVVIADPLTLKGQSYRFDTGEISSVGAPVDELRRMTKTISDAGKQATPQSAVVFITSRGKSQLGFTDGKIDGEVQGELDSAAKEFVDLLVNDLGATRNRAYRAIDPALAPAGGWSYSLAAEFGTAKAEGLEAEGPAPGGVPKPGAGIGLNGIPFVGSLTRSEKSYGFELEPSRVGEPAGGAGEKLREVVFSEPGNWPEQGNPGRTAAVRWMTQQVGLDSQRGQFWTQPYSVEFWNAKSKSISALSNPTNDGFTAADFAWAQKELTDEIGWLESAHGYVSTLAQPFAKSQLSAWADTAKISANINSLVQAPPTDKTLVEVGLLFAAARDVAEAIPEAGEVISVVHDIYDIAGEWAKVDAEGTEVEKPFQVAVGDVGEKLAERLQIAQNTLERQMVNVIAADYRKLRRVALCGTLDPACPDREQWQFTQDDQAAAAPIVNDGLKVSLYGALLPARYRAWLPEANANRTTNFFGHQPAGTSIFGWECPFHNLPSTAQLSYPISRQVGKTDGAHDAWQVIAYADRTGTGTINDAYVMHFPEARVTDPLFKPRSEGGLGVFPDEFYLQSDFETSSFAQGPTTTGQNGYPYRDSEVRWITKDDPPGIKQASCGY